MTATVRRRFWRETVVAETAAGWAISLDERPVNTPARTPLVLPTRALADAVATEWDAQVEEIRPETMPLTRAANTALVQTTGREAEIAAHLLEYGGTDLLCYRAEAPDALVRRQAEAWDPWLDWAEATLGARLVTVTGVMFEPQPPDAIAALERALRRHGPFELTALSELVTVPGSLVLGLAVSEGTLEPEAAWRLSRVDESWQEEVWGTDAEAAAQAARRRTALLTAHRFLTLARGPA